MKSFGVEKRYTALLQPDIVALLTQIHELKGKTSDIKGLKPDTLRKLVEIAKIQSTEASNKIEGIQTSDERLQKLVREKTTPRSQSEREIAGYRMVLNTIHENYLYMPPQPNLILQLHRDLYQFEGVDLGGRYKNNDNVIEEEDANGNKFVRFRPVSAFETPDAMENLCRVYNRATDRGDFDSLLLIPLFILDFLCIHPFSDGNGRMSRLLTLLLLYRAGYPVGKYISLEKLIEKTKESYYEALHQSSVGWLEDENDDLPFVRYLLGVVLAAYRDYSDRIQAVLAGNTTKPERVATVVKNAYGQVSKADILEKCPDISAITAQRALAELLEQKKIIKIGNGRYTKYVWNREENR